MGFDIVRITPENAHVLDRIAEDVFDHDIRSPWLAAYLDDQRHIMFVAVDAGQVIGQARGILHVQPDSPVELYVDNLGVAPARQRQGIATQLMQALVAAGQAVGAEDVWLGTEEGNEQAIGFYESLGLRRTKMEMFANFDED